MSSVSARDRLSLLMIIIGIVLFVLVVTGCVQHSHDLEGRTICDPATGKAYQVRKVGFGAYANQRIEWLDALCVRCVIEGADSGAR